MASPDGKCSTIQTMRLDDGTHEVENQSLASNLWERLPEDLIKRILAKLPFSSLLRFCRVCKWWRSFILSGEISPRSASDHGRLFYFDEKHKKLTIFSSSRGVWEIAALQCLEPLQGPENHLSLLDVAASAGGLLCFSTRVYGEFIVCNPITNCYKILQMPCGEALTIDEPRMQYPRNNDAYAADSLLVGMAVDSDTGHFQLIVAATSQSSWVSGLRRTALVYDSCGNSWKRIADVPEGGVHPGNLKPIPCGENIFFFFPDVSDFFANRLLKYEVKQQAWSWIPVPNYTSSTRNTVIEHNGKIVFMTPPSRDLGTVEFFQLGDSGPALWLPTSPLPLTRECDAFADLDAFDWFGQGDVIFFLLKRTYGTTGLEEFFEGYDFVDLEESRVWFHNVGTKFAAFSNWVDMGVFWGDFQCQVFKPSFLPIK